jgi:hypothetical protein
VLTSTSSPKIPFFQKSLNDKLKEAKTKTVRLPEDKAATFEEVLEYANRGKVSINLTTHGGVPWKRNDAIAHEASLILDLTIGSWILADKLCTEDLANALIDHYRACHKHFLVPRLHLAWLTKEGPPDNNMREFALEGTAWRLRESRYAKYR